MYLHCEAYFRHDVPRWLLRATFLTHHKPKHHYPKDHLKEVIASQQKSGRTLRTDCLFGNLSFELQAFSLAAAIGA
jgi:hypothetical protein